MTLLNTIEFENQTQTITPTDWVMGEYGRVGKRLFELASCKPLPEKIGQWPLGLMPLISNLYGGYGRKLPEFDVGREIPRTVAGTGKRLAVVGFTGGRDSVCVTCMLMHEGYDVHLLHFRGLNRSHYYEAPNCQRIAEKLGVPLTVRNVRVHGSSGDLSNRLRNQFLLCQQLDFAHAIGATAVTQGNHQADHLGNITKWIWFADARENYEAFKSAFPGTIEYRTGLCVNPSMVYSTIAKLRPDLLINLGSCVHPHMYMRLRQEQTEKTWGVRPLPGRCGVCYKCCWEYIVFGLLCEQYPETVGLVKLNREYTLHCLDVIRDKWHYFYDESLRPADRLLTARAILDEGYTPASTVVRWAESEPRA